MRQFTLLFIASLMLWQGCIGDDIIYDSIDASIRFSNPIDTIGIDETYQLEATFFNELGIEESASIEWESSAPEIIKVESNGLLTGVAEGSATITASAMHDSILIQASLEIATGAATVITMPSARTGMLQTTSSYVLEGSFTLESTDNGLVLMMGSDYRASSSLPGLYVYLTNNPNTVNGALEISMVNTFEGPVTFAIPGTPDLNEYEYVLFFCKPFGVKVGDGQFDN